MSGLSDNAKAALDAIKSGQEINMDEISSSGSTMPHEESEPTDTQPLDFLGINTNNESDASEDQPSVNESDTQEEANLESSDEPGSSDIEEVFVTDHKGRRKVKIDYSDRDKIKKMYQYAHGARKWQAAKDQAEKRLASLESQMTEFKEAKENFTALENAYESNGIAGLVDLLEGRQGAYQDFLSKEFDKREARLNATPEELELMNAREREAQFQRELDQMRKENEEFRSQTKQEKEQAEVRSMEAKIYPAFDKYRFSGKLGDATDEHLFDEMLWHTALKELSPYEEQGLDITPEMVERTFRKKAMAIRKRINVQANKEVKKSIKKKKEAATHATQSKVMSGMTPSSDAQEVRDLVKGNNISGIFNNWGKYSKLFNK